MLKNNLLLKIMSLLLAVLLWMYVMGEVDPMTDETVKDIPVRLLHQEALTDQELAIKGSGEITIDLSISGKRSALSKLPKEKIRLSADLEECREGTNQVPITVSLPDGISLNENNGVETEIQVERIISVYKPLEVVFGEGISEGTEPGQISTKPEQIQVTGAESVIASISSVQVPVKGAKLKEHIQAFYEHPKAVDKDGKPVKGVKLSAKTVEVRAILLYTKIVPLKIKTKGKLPKGYEVSFMEIPTEITIKGPKAVIDGIGLITAVDVDISKVNEDKSFAIKAKLPRQVEVANQSKDLYVKIIIK